MDTGQTLAATKPSNERNEMTTKLDKLLEQKRAIEARIAKLKNTEREERRAKALRVLEASGLLDLDEAELATKLAAIGGKKTGAAE